MADLNLRITLSARNRARRAVTGVRKDLRGLVKLQSKIATSTRQVEARWGAIPKVTQRSTRAVKRQNRALRETRREMRRITLEQAKRNELSKAHNRKMRERAKAELGIKTKRGFDPDAPATNLGAAAGAADRFASSGERGLRALTQAGLEFGTAVSEVGTLTDKIDAGAVRAITQQAAEDFGSLPVEQVRAFYSIVSAGADDATTAQEQLIAANMLAVAGVTDADTAVLGISKSVANFGVTSSEAANALFGAMQKGQLKVEDMSVAIPNVAQAAASMGLELDETAGVVALLSRQMRSAEAGSFAFKEALSNIEQPTKAARKEARRLGVDFSKAGIDAAGGFAEFVELIANNPKFNDKTLSRLFGSNNARSAIKGMISSGDELVKIIAAASTSSTELRRGFDKMSKDPAFSLKQANAEWENLKITLSEGVVPGLVAAGKAAGPPLKAISRFAAQHPKLASALGTLAIGSVGLAKVGGPLLHAASGLAGLTGGAGFGSFAGGGGVVGRAPVVPPGVKPPSGTPQYAGVGSLIAGLTFAAGAGFAAGTALDELTGASTHLAKFFNDKFGPGEDVEEIFTKGAGQVAPGFAGLQDKRRSQLAALEERISERKNSATAGALAFGPLGAAAAPFVRDLAGAGLDDQAASLRQDIRRGETGKSEQERISEAIVRGFAQVTGQSGKQSITINLGGGRSETFEVPAEDVEVDYWGKT